MPCAFSECADDASGARGARLEPDLLLPEQVAVRGAAALQPEKRLMLAILEDAAATLMRRLPARHREGRRVSREAARWLASTDTASPFAFLRICEALGLDAGCVRKGLLRAGNARDGESPGYRPTRRMAAARHRISRPRAARTKRDRAERARRRR